MGQRTDYSHLYKKPSIFDRMQEAMLSMPLIMVPVVGLTVVVFGIIGWFKNVFKIIELMGGDASIELAVRLIGALLFPFGAILGWF